MMRTGRFSAGIAGGSGLALAAGGGSEEEVVAGEVSPVGDDVDVDLVWDVVLTMLTLVETVVAGASATTVSPVGISAAATADALAAQYEASRVGTNRDRKSVV